MKAAAYLRVSTDAQAGEERFGLQAQREAIEDFARREGLEVVQWFTDEVSGAKGRLTENGFELRRPGLQDLLSDAKDGGFRVVVVAKLDRLARDMFAQLWCEKELLRHGVEVRSVAEPFHGSDPATVLFRRMIASFAEFERSRIAERTAGGRREKAKRGGYAGGGSPLGYRRERDSKRLAVDPEAAETVRRIFALRGANPEWSLQQLADAVNEEGHRTAEGAAFAKVQVKRVLDREAFYRGTYSYGGVQADGQHEAIL